MSEHIGKHVIYTDTVGVKHDAIVTNYFGQSDEDFGTKAAVNVVYTSSDEAQRDPYGRQIARECSVVPKASQPAHGRYYEVA